MLHPLVLSPVHHVDGVHISRMTQLESTWIQEAFRGQGVGMWPFLTSHLGGDESQGLRLFIEKDISQLPDLTYRS